MAPWGKGIPCFLDVQRTALVPKSVNLSKGISKKKEDYTSGALSKGQ